MALNKELDTYRVENGLDCEAARKNINKVSLGEFAFSYMPLTSVRDGLLSTSGRGGQPALAVPAVLSIALSNGQCHATLPMASSYQRTSRDLTSLGPAVPEEMPGTRSCRVGSPRLRSRKGQAGAAQTPLQGLGPHRKCYLHTFESMVI